MNNTINEEAEIDRELDDWLAKSTEFSKNEFFEKCRSIMSPYDLKEEEDGDSLVYKGKTLPQTVHQYDDEGNYHEKICSLNIEYRYTFDSKCCHTWAQISGHGEAYGGGGPVKTYEDLNNRFCVKYSDLLIKQSGDYGQQGNLFDDLFLFSQEADK